MNRNFDEINTIQTPCFLLDYEILERNLKVLKEAILKYHPNTVVGYSFKTNSLKYVCEYMKKKGVFAEVVSADEYSLAKSLGFELNKIIYNGIAKNEETFKEAIENEAIVNIDSKKEIEWAIKYNATTVGVRVNIDMERYCPGETTTGENGGRFGFSYESGDLKNVIQNLEANRIKVTGLHMHCSSKTRSAKVFDVISKKAVEIIESNKLNLKYLDVGGGFFGGVEGKIDFFDYFSVISKNIENHKYLTLIVEPGASLVASCFDYIMSVKDIKQTPYNNFVITDGTRLHIDPFFKKEKYEIMLPVGAKQILQEQVICGNTCMENDRILKIRDSSKLEIDDLIRFKKVGSYTMCFSPLFITYLPNVYLYKNGKYKKIMEKWTEKEYLQGML